jgi:hypothetical protein
LFITSRALSDCLLYWACASLAFHSDSHTLSARLKLMDFALSSFFTLSASLLGHESCKLSSATLCPFFKPHNAADRLTIFGVGHSVLQAVKQFFRPPHIRNPGSENEQRAISRLARGNFDERKFPTPIEEIVRCSRGFALCFESWIR